MTNSERAIERAIQAGKVSPNPLYNPNQIKVPIAMDTTIENPAGKLQDVFIQKRDELQYLLSMHLGGELAPRFSSQVTDYLTIHLPNVAFVIEAVFMDDEPSIGILIDPEKIIIRDQKVYTKNSGIELIFYPRMINYERIITFDAYQVGSKVNWSKIRNCNTYPYPPLKG